MHAVAGCRSGSPRVQRSDFDTVVGVYDQSLNQITCVDDADTPLAELSLLAEPGAQDLVQVGGYASHFGRLVLSVD